jgi:hypothetical protein
MPPPPRQNRAESTIAAADVSTYADAPIARPKPF